MKKELDEALVRDFPNLYRDRHGDKAETLMCWGFPGNGWEPLIRELSEKLEQLIKNGNWEHVTPVALQVKEKFGTLRFYMHGGTQEMYVLIDKAEADSGKICEACGEPGTLVCTNGWYRTECALCSENRPEWGTDD